MAKNIKELTAKYKEVYFIEDVSIIRLVCAVYLSRLMPCDPIWLMIVGASSSGKSEILNAITKAKHVVPISMLTQNTLLSGMRPKKGQETSMLLQIDRKSVLVMKDFTTILSAPKEEQAAIMAQMRELYDGKMVKRTGNGEVLSWEGKISLLAGSTESLFLAEKRFSGMGTRSLNYIMPTLDSDARIATTKRSAEIAGDIKRLREDIADEFEEYLRITAEKIGTELLYKIDARVSSNILELTDLTSNCRTPVERNFRGDMDLVLSAEMPMRMSNQLHNLGSIFMAMNDGVLAEEDEAILYKIALDSIGKGRRLALSCIAEWDHITTRGLAVKIGYDNDTVKTWLEDLNVLGIIERANSNARGDTWLIKHRYGEIIRKYDGIIKQSGTLDIKEGDIGSNGSGGWGDFT